MGRSREVLDEQKQLIRLVLRSITLDDVVIYGDADRSLVLPGRRESLGVQRTPRDEAEFAAAVRHLVDEGHPHVRWYLPTALRSISSRDRHILRLRIAWGHTSKTIKATLGLGTRFSVDQHVDTLLGELAKMLWTDHGDAIVPSAPEYLSAAQGGQ